MVDASETTALCFLAFYSDVAVNGKKKKKVWTSLAIMCADADTKCFLIHFGLLPATNQKTGKC